MSLLSNLSTNETAAVHRMYAHFSDDGTWRDCESLLAPAAPSRP